jgi:dihydropteroate synthase
VQTYSPASPLTLRLGVHSYDLTRRALVMGVLNRTSDSFFAPAATRELDDLLARAERLVRDGADVLDVGGVRAGPGEEVSEDEEIERVVPAVAELVKRFELPVSVDTWRASVAAACFESGAVMGNDISGFSDPRYLGAAAAAGATVVATHIRLRPREPDPDPRYDDVTGTVRQRLAHLMGAARAAGVAEDRVIVDAGLDLGKSPDQSLQLLRDTAQLASLGPPLLLSVSNKSFLGVLFDLPVESRREATLASCALGVCAGARMLRVHDVAGAVRVRDALAAIEEARR